MPFTRIVCPVDLSPLSIGLLRHAIAEADGPDAQVRVVHAVEPLLLQAATITGTPDVLRREINESLERLVRDATHAARPGPSIDVSVTEGAPETVILDAVAREGADLIVMGLHGMNALSKACFGSTVERVLRETNVPVLVRPPAAGIADGATPAMTHVIAAIDFRRPSMEAARLAADYAHRHHAGLTLLHVMPPPAPAWGRWGEAIAQQHEIRRQRAENELGALAHELRDGRRTPDIAVREGSAWEQIAAFGGDRPGALVVMGLAEPGRPFARPGSVAWRVLSAGAHPVLVVPAVRPGRPTRRRKHASRESYTEMA